MKSNWNYPTTVWTGENRSLDIVQACSFAKINTPLFVTDKDLAKKVRGSKQQMSKSYKEFVKEYAMGLQVPATSYLKPIASLNPLRKKENVKVREKWIKELKKKK